MSSTGTNVNNLGSTSIAIEQLPNGGIVVASNDHSEQNMLNFLSLSDTGSASRSVCARGGVVTHLSFIAVNRKNITTTMGMEKTRWRAHLAKVGRELMILKLVKYDRGVDGAETGHGGMLAEKRDEENRTVA